MLLSARRVCPAGRRDARSGAREIIFRTPQKSLFSSSCTRVTPRNRSSAVELLYKVSLPPWEHENPSDKTRLKVDQRPKICWARLPPQRHNKCARAPHRCLLQSLRHQLYQWPSSCSCQSCFCRCGHGLQQSTSESAAWQACHSRVLVLGVRGVVYVLRLVLGFQPHRSGLKESKICVRNQRFKGSIGSKSPLRGGQKKVEKKHFSLGDFRIWSRVVGSPKFSGQDVLP